ncbi:AAA domain-containing protein [Gigaspora margarita]|uniref:AAA domain-containing protein n=1 Tax=Gigaspora margarita TaxID=4874 RepID=A0A8H4AAZ6_GIGMA|nr:AAA domain-containing protein [Gigaspora margarita]
MSNNTTTFCDWRVEIYGCDGSNIFVIEVIISLISYALLSISGTLIFYYRYRYMWQGLFVDHGNGIRPLPVDCLLFFWTIASYIRALHSLLMLTNSYTSYLQRESIQELGFTVLCYGAVCYIIGIIYTIPVNYTSGKTTLKVDSKCNISDANMRDIILPRPRTLNYILAIWLLLPTVTVFPCAILSGIYRDHGDGNMGDHWTSIQYIVYFFIDLLFASVGAYYGINFMLILRGSMKEFNRKSANCHQSRNGTREALERLKYTMIYLAVLPLVSGPCWGMYGLARVKIISSLNLQNILFSAMWHTAGPQPLIAVCQYLLAKRVYQHYMGKPSSSQNGSTGSQSNLTLSQQRPTLARSPTSNDFGDYINQPSPNSSENFDIDLKIIQNNSNENNLLGTDFAVSVPAPAYGSEHDVGRRA